MTARVLSLSTEAREALRDLQAIKRRLEAEGCAWAPALAAAREKLARLVRGGALDGGQVSFRKDADV